MSIPKPKDFKMPEGKAMEQGRLGGLQAPKLSSEFVDVIQEQIAGEKKVIKAKLRDEEKSQFDLAIIKAENQAEREVIQPSKAEVVNTKGFGVLDGVPKTREKVNRQLDKIKSQYPEQYHPHIEAKFEKLKTNFDKTAIPHQWKETNDNVLKEYKVHTANRVNEAVEASGDPFDLENKLIELDKSVEYTSSVMGVSDAQKELNKRESRSKTLLQAVTYQATMGRLDIAERTLNQFGDQLYTQDRAAAVKALDQVKRSMTTNAASQLSDEAFSKYPDNPAMQYSYINMKEGADDRLKKQALGFLSYRQTAIKNTKEAHVSSLKGKIYADMEQGKDLNLEHYRALPPEEQEKITSMLSKHRGLPKVTNWLKHDELLNKLNDPVKAKAITLDEMNSYREHVSGQDMAPLMKQYQSIVSAENKEVRIAQLGTDADEILQLTNMVATSKKMSKRPEVRAQLKAMVYKEYQNILEKNPSWTRRQIRGEVLNRLETRGFKEETVDVPWYNPFKNDYTRIVPDAEGIAKDSSSPSKEEEMAAERKDKPRHPSQGAYLKKKYPGLSDAAIKSILDAAESNGADLSIERK